MCIRDRIVAGLTQADGGEIYYHDKKVIFPLKGEQRKKIQILFQHPEVSFNPMLPLKKSMEEPYHVCKKECSRQILIEDIEKFGLHEEHLERRPMELSGGELQRDVYKRQRWRRSRQHDRRDTARLFHTVLGRQKIQ